MTIGIVVFPNSHYDQDVHWALEGCLGIATRFVWYNESNLNGLSAIILSGGLNYSDYLDCKITSRPMPILQGINTFAQLGGKILGICYGFQILTRMRLLPGCLVQNQNLHFICQSSELRVQNTQSSWMKNYISEETISLPIAHQKGRYYCDQDDYKRLKDQGSIVLTYTENLTGSMKGIAGITNTKGNILGLIPHPERACDPITGSIDGRRLLLSLA
uniref:Phosphoribosylformylglycinamidine synthase n=1 Tax=Paulinella micropora TaxID=1928728 RepID=A0A385HZM3_9EUKA|nr:phosphoribosylformylglycinamidine synthase [Paulinella micropora]AXY63088.1 phosphoribosylformylglycinamidine synthase [Paulinella micropora]